MAVFPDRIVLKNSSDGEAAIVNAIQPGGTDEIQPGEIVLGLEPSQAKLYTRAADGSIVSLGGSGTGSVSTLSGLSDVNILSPLPSDGDVLAYDASTSLWVAVDPFETVDLGDLSDIDLTVPATDGQYLRYDATASAWKAFDFDISFDTTPSLGGDLNLDGFFIRDSTVQIAPSTGELVVRGGSSEGSITLNCTANTHGVTIQSPPHAAAATYTLTLPTTSGIAGEALIMTDGSGQLEWAAVDGAGTVTSIDIEGEDGVSVTGGPINTAGTFTIGLDDSGVSQGTYIGAQLTIDRQGRVTSAINRALGLDDVSDVDLSPAPTNGQALVYDATAGSWGPQTLSGTGTVTSIEAEGFNGISVSGSPITTSGKLDINLDDTGVTPGEYVFGTFEIDAQGRITSATDGPLTTNGDMIFQFGGLPNRLQVGSEGQALVVNGGYPSWQDLGTGGTVSSIDISGGIGIETSGGPITNAGTINIELAASGVTPGFYSNASVVVDERGRVISAQPGDQGVPVILANSAPTGREDGSALQNGDQWLDTDDDTLYVREDSSWTAISGGGAGSGGVTSIIAGSGISVDQSTGDVTITATGGGGGGGIEEAPEDGTPYARQDATWVPAPTGGSGGAGTVDSLGDIGDVVDYTGFSATGTWDDEIVSQLAGGLYDYPNEPGEWATYEVSGGGTGFFMAHFTDSNGTDLSSLFDLVVASPTDYSFRMRVNEGLTSPLVTLISALSQNDGRYRLDFNVSDLDPSFYNEGAYSGDSPSGGGSHGPFSNTCELDLRLTTSFVDPPSDGQVLTWVDANNRWEPADAVSGGGSGGGSGAGIYLQEAQTASSGAADFTGLGYSGILQKVSSSLDAWIVLYSSAAERTADAGRAYSTDPTPGSGVLFEAYVLAGGEVIATPGTTYMNSESTLTETIYAAVRDQSGAAVDATVTFSAYGLAAITAVSGGTFGSGL